MSQFRTKQIAGPTNSAQGAVLVFESLSKWSTDLTSVISLPSGSTLQRPVTNTTSNGMIRYNSDNHRLEHYENGSWVNTRPLFAELTDGPGTFQAGKALRSNAGGTGLEYYSAIPGFAHYTLQFIYSGSGTNIPTSVTNLPAGWSATINSTSVLVTHNLNAAPTFLTSWANTNVPNTTTMVYRAAGQTSNGLTMSYDTTNMNQLSINNITNTTFGVINTGGVVTISLYFIAV